MDNNGRLFFILHNANRAGKSHFMLPETTLHFLLMGLATSTLALAVSAAIISFWHSQRRRALELEHWMRPSEAGHEKALLQVQLEAQEATFSHISREIHDNIGQKLSLVKLYFNTITTPLPSQEKQRLGFALEVLSDTLDELRDLSHSMNSDYLARNGLVDDLRWEVDLLRKSGQFEVEYQILGEAIYMEASKELVVFRLMQEALNNVVRHAQARKINLQLEYAGAWLLITLSDNGIGFKREEARGMGIQSMQRRLALLSGELEIQTQAQQGTKIQLKIPLHEKANYIQCVSSR
jgi:two-component system NarL family sensor kinase